MALNNSGVVQVEEGTLRLEGGGTLGGTVQVQAAGTLLLQNGTYTLPVGASVGGTGAFVMAGGNATFAETLSFAGGVTMTGGTWTFNADQSFGTYVQSGGSLRGTGRVTITDTMSWTGGGMVGAGVTALAPGASGSISGSSNKDLAVNRVLENAGTLVMSGGPFYFNRDNLGGGAVINNLVGGELEIQGETDLSQNFASPSSVVNNAGLLRKTLGGVTQFGSNRVLLNNSGVVEVVKGTLRLDGGGTLGGTIDITAVGTVLLHAGDYTFAGGIDFLGAGVLEINRPIALQSATDFDELKVTFGGSASISGAFSVSNGAEGEFHVNKSMTFPGDMNIAELFKIVNTSHTVTVAGTLTLADTGTIDNAGALRVGAMLNQGGALIGNPPDVIGIALDGFVGITHIEVSGGSDIQLAGDSSNRVVVIHWQAPVSTGYVVEMSEDLSHWSLVDAQPVQSGLKLWETRLTVPLEEKCFFRIRWIGVGGSSPR